ncbi:MAG: Fe-S cluster assembly protein SufD [Pirellulales bacterium]
MNSTTGFTQEAFDAFLASRDEPAWLTQIRQDDWSCFLQKSMPSACDEEWMRTDIRLLKLDRFGLPDDSQKASADLIDNADSNVDWGPQTLLAEGVDLGGRAASYNSHPQESNLEAKWSDRGVLFGSLDALVAEHGDLLRPFFEQRIVDPSHDKFSALSSACWCGGTLLYVPKGVCIDQPFHSLSAMSSVPTLATGSGIDNLPGIDLGRTLVILEEGAEATMLSETASSNDTGHGLHCGTIELLVGKEASLRYVSLQNWNLDTWHFAHQRALIGQQGRLQWTIGALGSRLAKVNQRVALTGQDAESQVNGVMFTQQHQHLCYNTHQHHQAPNCHSDLLYKTALQDRSRTVWRGMIQVDKRAQQTNAYQRNDNLLLSPKARADSIPGLEIEADDVRCTHGSTSGRVDKSQLFYAMSRGYTRQEAIRMIVAGFFQQIFDRISIPGVRDALGTAIGQGVREL